MRQRFTKHKARGAERPPLATGEKSMKLPELTFEEFVETYWPCQHGGTWYTGSELVWNKNNDEWEIERCDYEALSVSETGILLGMGDPYQLFDTLQQITDNDSDDDVMRLIAAVDRCPEACFESDPKNSNYWQDFDGNYFDDGPDDDGYVWHKANGVLTDQSALDEWVKELDAADEW